MRNRFRPLNFILGLTCLTLFACGDEVIPNTGDACILPESGVTFVCENNVATLICGNTSTYVAKPNDYDCNCPQANGVITGSTCAQP